MTLADLTSRDAVLAAIEEFDQLGPDAFLSKYGYGQSLNYVLVHEGREYDSKAIVGAAHGFQFPEKGPLSNADFSGGLGETVPKLKSLGFEVRTIHEAGRTTTVPEASRAGEEAAFVSYVLSLLDGNATTYKHAVLLGLARLAARMPAPEGGRLPAATLAKEVAEVYWPQARPFGSESKMLRQTRTGEQIEILQQMDRLQSDHPGGSFSEVASQDPDRAARLVRGVELKLAEEPLPRLESGTPRLGTVDWKIHVPAGAYWEGSRAIKLVDDAWDLLAEHRIALADQIEKQWAKFVAEIPENPTDESAIRSFLFRAPSALHLLLRWSVARDPKTIEYHRAVAEELGSVWWGRLGDPEGRAPLADARRKQLDAQLENGTPTYAFLHRTGEVWRSRILEIRFDRPEDELDLIPDYYRDSIGEHHLWLKLADFEQLDPEFAEENLVLDNIPDDPDGIRTAFKGQQSLMYVREKEAPQAQPTVWWVNQGATYRDERDGGFLWAPVRNRAGNPLGFWDSLKDARVGDLVLHYAQGRIRAVGKVREEAREAPRPAGLPEGPWDAQGRILKVAYTELSEPVSLEQIPIEWRISAGAPFTVQGSVQQGYFYRLSPDFVTHLASRFPELLPGMIVYEQPSGEDYAEPGFDDILDRVRSDGLAISEAMLRRYHLSLKTRGFVILAGVSGSGKTWLAELYAKAVGAEHRLVAVAPNWTTNEDLLGYLSPISGEYQHTAVSEYLRDAAAEWEWASREQRSAKPFHLTLDEMNLARVEYYFAKFLSAMEVRARNGTATVELAPGHDVLLAPNLVFSGTVNVDETTHGFADKVYDRAQLVVLDADREALLVHMDGKPYRDSLIQIWDAIHDVAPFAFRVLDEIAAYVHEAGDLGQTWEAALDEQLLQKVLPKLKGADQRVGACLEELLGLSEDAYPLTHAKAQAMHDGFIQHGFASYF